MLYVLLRVRGGIQGLLYVFTRQKAQLAWQMQLEGFSKKKTGTGSRCLIVLCLFSLPKTNGLYSCWYFKSPNTNCPFVPKEKKNKSHCKVSREKNNTSSLIKIEPQRVNKQHQQKCATKHLCFIFKVIFNFIFKVIIDFFCTWAGLSTWELFCEKKWGILHFVCTTIL